MAYQAFAESTWGRIEPGASVDLVWLDRDPRTVAPLDIPAIQVLRTYLRDHTVFSATD